MRIDDPQVENQVIAAMTFWRLMAEHSRKHPSRHPGVEELFKQFSPMSIREIDVFLSQRSAPQPLYTTTDTIAEAYQISVKTLRRELKAMDCTPIFHAGSMKFYRQSDTATAIGRILKRAYDGKKRGRPLKLRGDRPGIQGGDRPDQQGGDTGGSVEPTDDTTGGRPDAGV